MTIPPDVVRDLELLSRSLAHPDGPSAPVDLVAAVTAMEEGAADAVGSYLGLRLVLQPPPSPDGTQPPPLTISTLPDEGTSTSSPVGSTLLVPLPAPGTHGLSAQQTSDLPTGTPQWRVDIVLHAANPGAFVDLAADLAWLVGTPLGDVEVDRHITPDRTNGPNGQHDQNGLDGHDRRRDGAVATASAVDQALGVLLARGLTPEEAATELTQRATRAGSDLAAAQELLSDLDQRPTSGHIDPNGRPPRGIA